MKFSGKVVFSSGAGLDFDIWSLDLDRAELHQLTSGENVNDYPRFSPDGRSVVWVRTEEDSIPSLWVMDADGGNKRRLTADVFCQSPSWSPDGREILFVGNAVDRNEMSVCVLPFDGGEARALCSYGNIVAGASFSPDGRQIIFAAAGHDSRGTVSSRDTDVMVFDIAAGTFSTVASHPAKDYGPAYSPDGRRISFISHRNGKSPEEYHRAFAEYRDAIVNGDNATGRAAIERMRRFEEDGDIFVMNADGSDLKQLTEDSRADRGVCWSPCGQYLMYTSAPKGKHEMERLHIIDSRSGGALPFHYDREAFESDIDARRMLNRTFFQKLTPDVFEKLFLDGEFFGEERNPHWIKQS